MVLFQAAHAIHRQIPKRILHFYVGWGHWADQPSMTLKQGLLPRNLDHFQNPCAVSLKGVNHGQRVLKEFEGSPRCAAGGFEGVWMVKEKLCPVWAAVETGDEC